MKAELQVSSHSGLIAGGSQGHTERNTNGHLHKHSLLITIMSVCLECGKGLQYLERSSNLLLQQRAGERQRSRERPKSTFPMWSVPRGSLVK